MTKPKSSNTTGEVLPNQTELVVRGMRRRARLVVRVAVVSIVVTGLVFLGLVAILFYQQWQPVGASGPSWQEVAMRLGPRTLFVVVAIYAAHLLNTVFRFANRVALHLDATADALELSRDRSTKEFVAYAGVLTPKYLDYDPLPPGPLAEAAQQVKALPDAAGTQGQST